jgi:hypothetical protein
MSPEVPQSPSSHQRTGVRLIFAGVEVEWNKSPVPQRIK